jgi:hypothetical protein
MPNVHPIAPAPLFKPPAGRAGDWSEPIWLDGLDVDALAEDAGRRRLPVDLLATFLLERRLLVSDLEDVGLARADALRVLDAAAVQPPPVTGPGRLHVAYIRSLKRGDSASHDEARDRPLMIPLRLHAAARLLDATTLRIGDIQQALEWECAAASDERFMREWGLFVTLRAARS